MTIFAVAGRRPQGSMFAICILVKTVMTVLFSAGISVFSIPVLATVGMILASLLAVILPLVLVCVGLNYGEETIELLSE